MIKTYVVTYQSQGRDLREAKKNLRDMFEFGYGNSARAIIDEMCDGLTLEKPPKVVKK
jgi:hypothetical protein